MEFDRYREAVAANRRRNGFEAVEESAGFTGLWHARDDDQTIGDVSLYATLVDATGYDADDLRDDTERFRSVAADRADVPQDSVTSIGYIAFALPSPDDDLVAAATSYTVAERRTCVFPLVYDLTTETLHTHPIPRLKGRGIYRRQADDATGLFAE